MIGVALTLRPFLWPDSPAAVSSGFVLVLLYMRGPIDQVIGILPALGRAQVAMRRIAELSEQFSTPEHNLLATAPAPPGKTAIESIELRGVTYAFRAVPGSAPSSLGRLIWLSGREKSSSSWGRMEAERRLSSSCCWAYMLLMAARCFATARPS